jgi:transcriptional regulator with PAS, ATPase and Fis domain
VERVAPAAEPVLLLGETGVGKTHIAQLIHRLGPRRDAPFVRINCPAIPEPLFEREMFGHVRGAFTDARDAAAGVVEAANGGTLFLDEISELPMVAQAKLLSAVEERAIRRLGSAREVAVDVRVIAASNCELASMVGQRLFRADLYYRLNYFSHHVAPIRDRPDELPMLAERFLRAVVPSHPSRPRVVTIHPDAMRLLQERPWNGNLRELHQALLYAVTMFQSDTIRPEHLPAFVATSPVRGTREAGDGRGRYAAPEDLAAEQATILEALRIENDNHTRAARRLGMSRSTLWAKLKFLGYFVPGSTAKQSGVGTPPFDASESIADRA